MLPLLLTLIELMTLLMGAPGPGTRSRTGHDKRVATMVSHDQN